MSEVHETVIEADTKNNNEQATESIEDTKPEDVKAETPEETPKEEPKETPKEEATKEDEEFKNKTDRMKHKKVKCDGCQAEMTLKTLRYSHKCNGKTEDKPIKPKPKARSVAVKPIENQVIKTIKPTRMKEKQEEIHYSKPIEVKTKASVPSVPVRMERERENIPPPKQLTATELLQQHYNEIRKAKQQEKAEKIERFKSSMF